MRVSFNGKRLVESPRFVLHGRFLWDFHEFVVAERDENLWKVNDELFTRWECLEPTLLEIEFGADQTQISGVKTGLLCNGSLREGGRLLAKYEDGEWWDAESGKRLESILLTSDPKYIE